MNILFLSNNSNTKPLYDWLKNSVGENIIYFEEKLNKDKIIEFNPDFVISYNYKYILGREVIDMMNGKIINLHISLLPWNRGAHPNVWSFFDNTPKGVTIHLIDEEIDTGNILLRKEVFFDECRETLQTSYDKLNNEIQELFKSHWNDIKQGKIEEKNQEGKGSLHYIIDFEKIRSSFEIDLWNTPIKNVKKIYQQKLDEGVL